MPTNLDLASWLKHIGLSQHVEQLRHHGLDLDVAADLSDEDLVALGLSLGDRRRFLREAALLSQDHQNRPRRLSAELDPDDSAERRRLTILFCDLVDSTTLVNRLDPEEVSAIIGRYLRHVSDIADRYGGHTDRLVGDGLLVCFGWPVAHEDQVERAAAAGLAIVREIGGLDVGPGPQLCCRVGIATGDVVVGEILGGAKRWETVFGPTPNLAARLQSAALPQTVLVDASTAQDLRANFVLEEIQPLPMKGFAEPVHAWRVLDARPQRSRFFARASSPLPFVGREDEFARLHDEWGWVERGSGRVLLVSGEPGIGKSRLMEAFVEKIGPAPNSCLRYQCDALHSDTPLHPIIQQMAREFGLESQGGTEERRKRLADAIRPLLHDDEETIGRLATLFGTPEDAVDRSEPPVTRRQRTLNGLVELIARRAMQQPLILLVEDLQWADPTTEEVLRLMTQRFVGLPILLAVTCREPFAGDWLISAHVGTLTLPRLDRHESATLVRNAASCTLDESTVLRIADSADGIPLFLEEMTKCAIEEGVGASDGMFGGRNSVTLPTTLQASLNSRLDHLGSSKRSAQVGAVIGRDFSISLLGEVIGRHLDEVDFDVERLVASGLATRRDEGVEPTLRYRHALFQEAAYSSLLLSERKRLHGLVLDAYERRFAHPDDELAQILAQHAIQAERWDKAARYVGLAYRNAVQRSANREAVSLFNRAIDVIGKLPQEVAAPLAIDLRLHAFTAFHTLGDNGKLVELIREAARLAELIGDRRRLAAASTQTAFALWMEGKHSEAQKCAESALAIAQLPKDFSIAVSVLFNLANIHQAQGNIVQAVKYHRQVLSMLRGGLENKRLGWPAAPSAFARAFASWCLIELGEFSQAEELLVETETYPDPIEPHGLVMITTGRGNLLMRRGDFGNAVDVLRATLELCRKGEVLTMTPIVSAWLGHALCGAGRVDEALAVVVDAVERETYRFGGKYTWVHLRLALAEALRLNGQLGRAAVEAEVAFRIADDCGELVHSAYSILEKGRISLTSGEPAATLQNADEALAVARSRGLRPFAAECLCVKARALAAEGKAREAESAAKEASALLSQLGLMGDRLFSFFSVMTAQSA